MGSPSKEEQLLMLLLENSPLRQWHFEELLRETGMARASLNKWLTKYRREGIVKQVKEKGKFPYLTCGSGNPAYISRKRLYMLDRLYESGLVSHILSLKGIKAAVVFGSAAKGDWYKGSDIDLFLLGNPEGIEKHKFELKLKREIELHAFGSKEEVKKVRSGLIANVIGGYFVKGSIQDFAEVK